MAGKFHTYLMQLNNEIQAWLYRSHNVPHEDPLKDLILYLWNAHDNKNVKTLQFALVGGLLVLCAGQGVSLRRVNRNLIMVTVNWTTLRYLTLST